MTKSKSDKVIDLPYAKFIPDADDVKLDSLVIRARDKGGFKESINVHMPSALFDAVMAVVHHPKSLWSNGSEAGRAAYKLLVDFWANMNPDIRDSSEYINLNMALLVLDEEEKQERIRTMLGRLGDLIAGMGDGAGADAQARKLLLRLMEQLRKMAPGHHRNECFRQIKEKHGERLKKYGIEWDAEMECPAGIGDLMA